MKKLYSIFFLFFLLFWFSSISAQILDTMRIGLDGKMRFAFKFDTRNSFITNSRARIFGFKLGVDFDRKFRVGGGFNSLNSDLYKDKNVINQSGTLDVVKSKLSFYYFSYFFEYVFYKNKQWEFTVPLQLGIGDSRYKYVYNNKEYIENKKVVIIYESTVSGNYKFFNWLGVGADIGYRLMVRNNKAIKENFNSPTYAFKVLIFYGDLYKAIFPNSKLTKKFFKD